MTDATTAVPIPMEPFGAAKLALVPTVTLGLSVTVVLITLSAPSMAPPVDSAACSV